MFHFVFLSGCEQYGVFKEVQSTMPTLKKKKLTKNLVKSNLNKTHCFLFQNAFEKTPTPMDQKCVSVMKQSAIKRLKDLMFFKKYVEYFVVFFFKNYG